MKHLIIISTICHQLKDNIRTLLKYGIARSGAAIRVELFKYIMLYITVFKTI